MIDNKKLIDTLNRVIEDFKPRDYLNDVVSDLIEIRARLEPQPQPDEYMVVETEEGLGEIRKIKPQPDDLVEKILDVGVNREIDMHSALVKGKSNTELQKISDDAKAEIRKLLPARPSVDIKRLAHLLYLSIPLSLVEGQKKIRLTMPHYGETTKRFEDRLKDEFKPKDIEVGEK